MAKRKVYFPFPLLVSSVLTGAFLPLLFLVYAYFYTLPAHANEVIDDNWFRDFLDKCYAIENTGLRLECYDTLAKATRETEKNNSELKHGLLKKQAIQKIPQQVTKSDVHQQFGLSPKLQKKLAPDTTISITAKVINVSQSKRNMRTFYFDNGQIWKQKKAEYVVIPKNKEFSVVISRGAVGDYRLRVNGKGKMTRVKRIN